VLFRSGAAGLSVDGVELEGKVIPLLDDHREHTVMVKV
jgi:hypothetical protein